MSLASWQRLAWVCLSSYGCLSFDACPSLKFPLESSPEGGSCCETNVLKHSKVLRLTSSLLEVIEG